MKLRTIKQILAYTKPYMKMQAVGFVFTILYSLTLFLTPLISKHLIDNVIGSDSTQSITVGILLFSLVCLAQPITSYIKDVLFAKIGEKTAGDIRGRMFRGIVYAPLRQVEEKSSGEIVSRISQDGYMASRFVTELAVGIIKNLLICTMIIVGLIMLSPLLSAISLLIFAVSMLLTSKMSQAFESIQSEVQKKHDDLCRQVDGMVQAISQVKGYELEEAFNSEFGMCLDEIKRVNTKAMIHSARIQNVSSAIMVLILCILYGGGSLMVMNGQLTIGTVIGLGLYFQLLMQPVYELIQQKAAIHKAVPILERIGEYEGLGEEFWPERDLEKEHDLLVDGLALSCGIRLDDISFKYKESKVLEHVNASMPRKGLVLVEGVSGSGKSTLLKIISGLYKPESGQVLADGPVKCHSLEQKCLRRLVAYVEQQPPLYDSVLDKLSRDRAGMSPLELEFLQALEESFLVSTDSDKHSGGERQRQALINALYKKTDIWVLDEPLSALDGDNRNLILKHVEKLKQDKLIIVAAHSRDWQAYADMTLTLSAKGQTRLETASITA